MSLNTKSASPTAKYKPVVHIGLPKAASTFLQRRCFPSVGGYYYISSVFTGRQAYSWPMQLNWLYGIDYSFRNFSCFDEVGGWHTKKYRSLTLAQWVEKGRQFAREAPSPLFISAEGLCGLSYSPLKNAKFVAQILKEILDDFKVLLIVRRQDDWCESLYNQLVFKENRYAKYISFESMFSFAQNGTNKDFGAVRDLDWSRLAKIYMDLVGAENVTVLPYESLSNKNPLFFDQLSNFFGQNLLLRADVYGLKDNPRKLIANYKRSTVFELVKHCAGAVNRGEFDRMVDLSKEILSRVNRNASIQDKVYVPL